ncbi:MAG: hypothetical protein RIC80_15745, partial [Cyclobacteriaceae bacterium]
MSFGLWPLTPSTTFRIEISFYYERFITGSLFRVPLSLYRMWTSFKPYFLCTLLIGLIDTHCEARQKDEGGNRLYSLEYGVGLSGQFILANKRNPNISVTLSQIPNRNPQGLGLPVYIHFFLKNGWGLEYAPTIRYDHIRFTENTIFDQNSINEWIIDHHFSLLLRLAKDDPSSPVVGFGYSIISTGKSVEGGVTFSNSFPGSPIFRLNEINYQFSGWHFLMRWNLFDLGLRIEPKLLFVSGGKISYKPNSTLTIMSVVSLKYALSRLFSKS